MSVVGRTIKGDVDFPSLNLLGPGLLTVKPWRRAVPKEVNGDVWPFGRLTRSFPWPVPPYSKSDWNVLAAYPFRDGDSSGAPKVLNA
jgi:hypothetical protein